MKVTRRMRWILVAGTVLGLGAFGYLLTPRPTVCLGATVSEVGDYIRSERGRGKVSVLPFRRVRDQPNLLLIPGTLSSRGEVPDNVGTMSLLTDYSLRTNHVFATHVTTFHFGVTNGNIGRVIRITSKWEWRWDL